MTFSLKQVAVAAVAVVSFASAHAAPYAIAAQDTFTLGSDIAGLLAKVVIAGQGGATFSSATAVLSLPSASTVTTLSNANATDLISFAQGAGLQITSGADVISLTDLSFNNATKSIDAIISLNGKVTFTGTALTATTASIINTAFDPSGVGALTSGEMHMTTGAASALANALGFAILAPAIPAYNFGTFKVTAVVPEPSTYALMGLGLVGVALAARKRKSA